MRRCALLAMALLVLGSTATASAQSIYVTTFQDDNEQFTCSLREAIRSANEDVVWPGCIAGQGEDVVILGAGTYTLWIPVTNDDYGQTGDLDVNSPYALTIQGNPAGTTIDANGIDRAIDDLDPAALTINDIRVIHGN